MPILIRIICLLGSTLLFFVSSWAGKVIDDHGRMVNVAVSQPRIISLAPHITETLFAIGAGDRIIAVDTASDFPADVARLPKVADATSVDLEKVLALHPDVIIAWYSPRIAQQLNAIAIPVYYSDPQSILDIAKTMQKFGRLVDHEKQAKIAAQQFYRDYQKLRQRYAHLPKQRVFYQLWQQPLLTVGRGNIINEVLSFCGGENVFQQPRANLIVDVEAVLIADPQVIVADAQWRGWRAYWLRWPNLAAVRTGKLVSVPSDWLQRYTPRLLQGVALVCQQMQ